jgi:membrane peptidoglycan carboxypeptidase
MAGAYATFASGGIRHNPIAITDVQSYNGKYNDPSPASKNPGRRVVPDYYASEMNQILEDNVSCGVGICTGNLARLDDREAAGKTGTVEEHQDAWFCGYTPVLTTCVWMGYPEGDSDAYSMIPALGSTGTFGGGYPTEIWHDYMQQAFSLEPSRYPPDPFTVVEAPSTAWAPWTSQFQLSAPPPTKPDKNKDKNGGGNGGGNGATTGGGGGTTSGGGGGTTTGGGGGGTTTPPTT